MEKIDYSIALRTVMAAADLLKEGAADPDRALQLLKPLEACDNFPSVSAQHSTVMMSAIWASFGDCHRLLDQPREAAECYRRAFTYSPLTGFSEFYADLVMTHCIKDHYQTALKALNAAEEAWDRNTWWVRLKYNLISMWKDIGAWKMSRKNRTLASRLAELLHAPLSSPKA